MSTCLDLKIRSPGTRTAGAKAYVEWVGDNCDIAVEHKGTFTLDLIDALAAALELREVSLWDASSLNGVSLSWFRAMTKGQGWYESHGYVSPDEVKRLEWEEAVKYLRFLPVESMRNACELVRLALQDTTDGTYAAHALFVKKADEYATTGGSLPEFGAFVAWLAATDFQDLQTLFTCLFRRQNDSVPVSARGISEEVRRFVLQWRSVEEKRPSNLTKTFGPPRAQAASQPTA